MAIEEAEKSDCEEEINANVIGEAINVAEMSKKILYKTEWIDAPAFVYNDRKYYDKARVGKF